jgi:hypothetical protein
VGGEIAAAPGREGTGEGEDDEEEITGDGAESRRRRSDDLGLASCFPAVLAACGAVLPSCGASGRQG